ncbi:MAG: hypothetical protein MJ177_02745 [Clostridia bacterium]|nr:hypothetical protein [Clostridia bacterium]
MLRELADCCEVYLVTGYTDMRKGIDGLAAMIAYKRIYVDFMLCECYNELGEIHIYKNLHNISRFQVLRRKDEENV